MHFHISLRLFKFSFSILLLFFVVSTASAAELELIKDKVTDRVIGLKPGETVTAGSVPASTVNAEAIALSILDENKDHIGLTNPDSQLELVSNKKNATGFSHVKYRQVHQGLPVLGEAIVHLDPGGSLQLVSANIATNLPKSVRPKISKEKAEKIAEAYVVRSSDSPYASLPLAASNSELMIVPLDIIKRTSTPDSRLAWKVRVFDEESEGKKIDRDIYLDAVSGSTLLEYTNIRHDIQQYINDCSVDQPPYDCARDFMVDYPPVYYHGRSYNQPARGPFPPLSTIYDGSMDVDDNFYLLGEVHQLVFDSFGLDGADGVGGTVIENELPTPYTDSAVHLDGYDPGGCASPNAFMYGNGSFGFCLGMSAPDMVAHEYGHALDLHHAGLANSYEAGALAESYSDVFGEYGEEFITGSYDWQHGTDSIVGQTRDLSNPHSKTTTTTGLPYPDRYFDQYFYCGSGDYGGVHINSTVISHAFYLFSEGGEHNGCEIQGQGIDAANQVYFEALANYFSSSENFNSAYDEFLAACDATYIDEPESTACDELTKALQAIAIDQGPGPCSGGTEVAPACAVNNIGSIEAVRPDLSPSNLYAPGESIYIAGTGGVEGKDVDLHLTDNDPGRINWSEITSSYSTTVTVGSGGDSENLFMVAGAEGTFDIIADANQDGDYQLWADSLQTIEVKQPVDGDGMCYQGESYTTSENCNGSPQDCGCPSSHYCGYVSSISQYRCIRKRHGGGCFLADTNISLADGSTIPIQNVQIGQKVKAYNPGNGQIEVGTVSETFVRQSERYLLVNNSLKVTPNHPMLVVKQSSSAVKPVSLSPYLASDLQWVQMENLKVGDLLVASDGSHVPIKSIEAFDEPVEVYNFTVLPQHTYVAGGFVVHNRSLNIIMQEPDGP